MNPVPRRGFTALAAVAGPEKARLIREHAREHSHDLDECFAYSDSYSDVPMLSVVGHPAAVNPDGKANGALPDDHLKETLKEHGLDIAKDIAGKLAEVLKEKYGLGK